MRVSHVLLAGSQVRLDVVEDLVFTPLEEVNGERIEGVLVPVQSGAIDHGLRGREQLCAYELVTSGVPVDHVAHESNASRRGPVGGCPSPCARAQWSA